MVKPILKGIYFWDKDLYKRLKHLAVDKNISVSKLIESVLSEYVKNEDNDS